MKTYGSEPVKIASNIIVDNSEMYFYQYLPIAIPNVGMNIPEQLERLRELISKCFVDYRQLRPEHKRPYVYVTAKCLYLTKGENLNRMGWHCDGFMSNDINYIWSDCIPTEYVVGDYMLTQDHDKSLYEMNKLLYNEINILKTENNSLYRLDDTVIHRCGYHTEDSAVLRHFVKVSFSEDIYNLKGNSHNYELGYQWEMKDRVSCRNHPTK